jgi:hypothetical protein
MRSERPAQNHKRSLREEWKSAKRYTSYNARPNFLKPETNFRFCRKSLGCRRTR